MGEFTGHIAIDRPAAEVFAFLADIRNMPRYLPTVRRATDGGDGKVVLEGEADGHAYRDTGWLKAEPETRRLRWGSDSNQDYRGELLVAPEAGRSQVTLRLSVTPPPAVAQRMQAEHGSVDHAMRLSVERCLNAIRQCCEGGTGSAESPERRSDDLPDSRPFGTSATLNPDI